MYALSFDELAVMAKSLLFARLYLVAAFGNSRLNTIKLVYSSVLIIFSYDLVKIASYQKLSRSTSTLLHYIRVTI